MTARLRSRLGLPPAEETEKVWFFPAVEPELEFAVFALGLRAAGAILPLPFVEVAKKSFAN